MWEANPIFNSNNIYITDGIYIRYIESGEQTRLCVFRTRYTCVPKML